MTRQTDTTQTQPAGVDDVRTVVKDKYGAFARSVEDASGCRPGACCGGTADPITSNLYSDADTATAPPGAGTTNHGRSSSRIASIRSGVSASTDSRCRRSADSASARESRARTAPCRTYRPRSR